MGKIKQIIAGLVAAFGAFCLGASIGWSGPMERPVKEGEAYPYKMSVDSWGWVSSALTLGAALACIPVGILIAKFGRKTIMIYLVPPYLVGWGCIMWAEKDFMLYIGRFIIGACGGAFCVTSPVYTTEVAEITIRGIVGCFFQFWLVFGVLYGFGIGALFKPAIINILCAILPVIFFLAFLWMPESPVYLMQMGYVEQAENAMKWLRGRNADFSADMSAMEAEAKKEKPNVKKGMRRLGTIMGLSICITLMFFQQFSGIYAIIFYSTSIFEKAGTGISSDGCTVIIGSVQVLATVAAVLSVEKVGRRILLLLSSAVMGITTLTMGMYFHFLKDSDHGWLPLLATCLFIVGFSMGFGPVPWLVIAEFFGEDVKPLCSSIAGTCNWVFAFCVTKGFPLCLDAFGVAPTFWMFAAVSVLAFVFIILMVPETKGRTLNEIQELLGD